jgi:hypothetical protein
MSGNLAVNRPMDGGARFPIHRPLAASCELTLVNLDFSWLPAG